MSAIADMALAFGVYRYQVRGPAYTVAPGSMHGRVCIVTGCNTGIGLETAEALARAGATVVFACRSEDKARQAMERVLRTSDEVSADQLLFLQLDLSSLQSVRNFVEAFQKTGLDLHVLILNAGAILQKRAISKDGFDMAMAANYFGHFLLVQLLLPTILETERRGGQPRIVQVNSAFAYKHETLNFDELARSRMRRLSCKKNSIHSATTPRQSWQE